MSSPFAHNDVVRASARQMSGTLEDETVVLNLADGMYYTLDPVAARIWELVQDDRTVGDIESALLAEFEVEPERCREDLARLLGELLELELIEVEGGATP